MSVVEFGFWGQLGARRGSAIATTIPEPFVCKLQKSVLFCFN